MNIQPTPPASLAGLAGTQRAAAKSADSDANAASVSAQQKADKPGGVENGLAEVEKDAAAGDSGADGRQQYESSGEPASGEHPATDSHGTPPHAVNDENTGQHLDLDA